MPVLRTRSASSRYLRTAPRVTAASSGSSARAPSAASALAQSSDSATPGGLMRSSSRIRRCGTGDLGGQALGDLRQPGAQDGHLPFEGGVLDQWYRQRRLSASCTSRVRLLVSTVSGGLSAAMRPSSGMVIAASESTLEQERLELVVGPVDLVDQQHRRAALQGLQQRPGDQEAPVVEACLKLRAVWPVAARDRRGLDGAQVQDLPGKSQS